MPKLLGNIVKDNWGTGFAYNVFDKHDISPTIRTFCGGGQVPYIISELKDIKMNNEIKKVGQISSNGSQYGAVISEKGCSATLSAGTHGYANNCIQQKYKIRKLTPKECFRLMNFDDEDYYAAESVNSNTQLYKQAGNSIVVSCLVAIFSQLNIQGIKTWNEMSLEEQYKLSQINICDNPQFEKDIL